MAQVFRTSSLERAASPESLDDYIQVSNPSVWMILGAIVLLLVGALVWACFGHLSDVQRGVLVVTLLGMVVPQVNAIVFGPVVQMGDAAIIAPIAALLVGVMFSQVIVDGVKSLVMTRISTRLALPVQAAAMMRLLSLPASFFGKYQTGELAQRVGAVNQVASMLENIAFTCALTSVFSLVYIVQIWTIAPSPRVPRFSCSTKQPARWTTQRKKSCPIRLTA